MMDTLTNFKSILRVFLMTVPNIQMEKWNVISYFFLVLLNWPPFSKKANGVILLCQTFLIIDTVKDK